MFIMSETDRLLFISRLRETKIWCAEKLKVDDPEGSLRSRHLRPSLVKEEQENLCRWNYEVLDPIFEIDVLCRKRAEDYSATQIIGNRDETAEFGRILMFYPHQTLVDGAARQSSDGYFDDWNIPPWDTWFWYRRVPEEDDVLYSWVPGQFVKLAEVGVSVNPEECFRWLERNPSRMGKDKLV